MFDIREFVDFDSSNRAICPACHLSKGTGYKSKTLSVFQGEKAGVWAYKCYRGCTKDEIRNAIGQPIDRLIPQALTTPPKNVLVTPQKVKEAHEALLKSKEPLQWLLARGIDLELINRYRLGLGRAKCGKGHLQAIAIPIPANADGTKFYQKKRVAPWLPEEDRPEEYKPWSQYGIPPMVYFTHKPENPKETWLCEGEWDAIRLGWEMRDSTTTAVACFTCGAGNIPPQEELDRLPKPVTTFYDRDEAGLKGSTKLQQRMGENCYRATVPAIDGDCPKGWDISDVLEQFGAEAIGMIGEAAAYAEAWKEPKKENLLRSRFLTNDEMLAEARDYVEWLVPDLFTADELFILGMPPRGGKSIFCLTLALSVAVGGTFLDRPVTQGSVIYINLEDAPTKVKQRQIAQQWGQNLPVFWMDKFKLSELDSLKELADEIPDLRLVILDTFSRVRDDNQKESSAELGKTLEPLQEWAKDRGICILITHHTSKAPTDGHSADPFDTLRGSTSIRATCRGAIVIVPAENGYRLLAENGYSDRLDVLVRINPTDLKWKLLGNWSPRIDGDMKAQILDHITLMGEGTVSTIATALQFNAASVSTIMARLHRDGMVSKVAGKGRSPGVYSRSSNLLKLMEPQFEQPNLDTTYDTDLLKQDNLYGVPEGKVIIEGESDHLSDHFSQNTPTQDKLFEQSYRASPDSDVCSNSENPSLSKAKPNISVSSDVRYKGDPRSTIGRQCGKTVMKVMAIHDAPDGKTYATVGAMDWTQTQTVALKNLKLV
jgi:AAA domain